jgi:hypothetical protein
MDGGNSVDLLQGSASVPIRNGTEPVPYAFDLVSFSGVTRYREQDGKRTSLS